MKKIKIKICEFGFSNEQLKNHFIYIVLEKYYEIELSEEPDYLFYNESSYEHLDYDCIKIFYTGENISPNFNLCDYAIAFDYMTFGDRYYRFPLYLSLSLSRDEWAFALGSNVDVAHPEIFTKEDLAKKTEFCSFIYSNYLADDSRKNIFNTLGTYKKVNAAGAYLNNTGGLKVGNKLEYELKHKFSIAFENSSRPGYTTEKLYGALGAKTIPIYWGNPEVSKEFNDKRFINCHNFKNLDEVLKRVKEIDANDELYLDIINQPTTVPSYNFDDVRQGLDDFLKNIFDQPLESARRRTINLTRALQMHEHEMLIAAYVKKQAKRRSFIASLYKPFKEMKIFEGIKHGYLQKKTRDRPKS